MKLSIYKQIYLKSIITIAILWCFGNNILSAQESEKPNVLILHSYHQQFKWTNDITKGIKSILDNKCNLQIQYMDTKRQFDEEYQKILFSLIYHKHKKNKYNAIIASDNNALSFLNKKHETIFGNTPVIFCGINYAKKTDFDQINSVTGVNESVDLEKNIQLIKKLQPDAKRLFVIVDETSTGKIIKQHIEEINSRGLHPFDTIEMTNNNTMYEVERRLSSFSSTDAVLLTLFFRDSNDDYFSYGEIARRVVSSSPVPVFGLWDFYIGNGVAGGYMVDGFSQGVEAAKLAQRIIMGQQADKIPIIWESPNKYKFDFSVLDKYNIDLSLLPKDARIINEPYSLYENNQNLFWQIVLTISLLSLLTILLVVLLIVRKQLARKVHNKNIYLETLLNSVGEGIIDIGPDNRIRKMNPIAEIITGCTEQQAYGKLLKEIFPVTKSSKPGKSNAYHILTNKQQKTYKLSYTKNILSDNDKDLGEVITFTDITQIIENEERFSRLTDNAQDLIYRIRLSDGIFEYISKASKEILGYEPSDLYKDPMLFKRLIAPGWKNYVLSNWLNARKGKLIDVIEFQIADKSGNIKWVNQRNVLVYNDEGNPIALEGIMTDISKQKNIENRLRESLIELEKAKEKAEESDKLKSAFLANIAHEIRTPMNGIIGFSQLLRSHDINRISQKKYVDIIQKSSEQLINLIDDLVNISQIETGQSKTKIKEIKLEPFINKIHELFKQKAARQEIDFISNSLVELKGKTILADQYKIDYSIRKLISNAIKYTKNGSVSYSFTLCDGTLEFKVTDTGIGISLENQKKIFERFIQIYNDPFKPEDGAGLGLAIAQSFIRMMGGEIKLDSEPGKGSTFWFAIPVKEVNPGNEHQTL